MDENFQGAGGRCVSGTEAKARGKHSRRSLVTQPHAGPKDVVLDDVVLDTGFQFPFRF